MDLSVTYAGQISITVLSLFGGFPKKIAPPDRRRWLWTGLASLIAAIGFFAVKLSNAGGWTPETRTAMVRAAYVLLGLLAVLCFAYVWALRTRTAEYAKTFVIVGSKLTLPGEAYKEKNPNATQAQLLLEFGGKTEAIWTPQSVARARFILLVEYALVIALLALSFNLGIELLNHPAADATAARPALAEEGAQLHDVHFAPNKSDLSEDAREKLTQDATVLSAIFKDHPKARLIVEGYCDDRGGIERNLALGYQRADTVKRELTDDGIEAAKIRTASFGKGAPLCFDADETCRRKNRRVHLRVVP